MQEVAQNQRSVLCTVRGEIELGEPVANALAIRAGSPYNAGTEQRAARGLVEGRLMIPNRLRFIVCFGILPILCAGTSLVQYSPTTAGPPI